MHISAIAYGNFLTHGEKVDAALARECAQAALEEAITTFDTADSYAGGAAAEVLGKALNGVRRDTIEVCTKVFFPLGEPARPNARGLSRKHVMESIDGSLRRLGLDYVDIYLAHRYDPEVPLGEILQTFTGKYVPGQPPPPASRAVDKGRGSELIRRWMTDDVLTAVQELKDVAEGLGMPLARLALAWVLARRNVVGGSRPDQIRENVLAATVTLPDDALARIEEIVSGLNQRKEP
jgi:aryl-alcohol dehydrogenase-like predicted oxidoreductase